jgi:hypothetical protein
VQVPPEAVGLDLSGLRADPVLGPPRDQAVPLVASGGLDQDAEERVHSEPVGEVLAASVALVGDPGQVRDPDALDLRADAQARLGEEQAVGWSPLPEAPPRGERGDEVEMSQLLQPVLTSPEGAEVQALDLLCGEDLVLEQAEQESMVSLIERDHANVSFSSNHILGTALPPPSVGSLRQRGPVTWPFALPRPAPSRRPRAVLHGSEVSATPRSGAGAHTARSTDLQFVPMLTSSSSLRTLASATGWSSPFGI